MPLVITGVRDVYVLGNLRLRTVDAAFDASYASGGEPLTAATLGFDQIYYLRADAVVGYVISYDYTNATLRAYRIGIASSSIVSGANNTIVKNVAGTGVEVSGTGTAFQAALSEVTTGADMSIDLASVRLLVIGVA